MWIKIFLGLTVFGLTNWGIDSYKNQKKASKALSDSLSKAEKAEKIKTAKKKAERKKLDKIIEKKYYEMKGRGEDTKKVVPPQVIAPAEQPPPQPKKTEKTEKPEKPKGGEK